jgi:hypothetical protein
MESTIHSIGRRPRQRTTTYGQAPEERYRASFSSSSSSSPLEFRR